MENAYLIEQEDGNATSFALADFTAKIHKKCLYVFPGDVRAGWVREDSFQSPLMGAFHVRMVPEHGTDGNAGCFLMPNVGGKLALTVGRAGQVGENVERTAYLARVARRWGSA